jgi:hypothetical protein
MPIAVGQEKTACFQPCSGSVGTRDQRLRTMLVRRVTRMAAPWCRQRR